MSEERLSSCKLHDDTLCITGDKGGKLRLRGLEEDPTGNLFVSGSEIKPEDNGWRVSDEDWQGILRILNNEWAKAEKVDG